MTVLSGFYGNNPCEGDPAGPSKSWADICCTYDTVVGGNMRTDTQPSCFNTMSFDWLHHCCPQWKQDKKDTSRANPNSKDCRVDVRTKHLLLVSNQHSVTSVSSDCITYCFCCQRTGSCIINPPCWLEQLYYFVHFVVLFLNPNTCRNAKHLVYPLSQWTLDLTELPAAPWVGLQVCETSANVLFLLIWFSIIHTVHM